MSLWRASFSSLQSFLGHIFEHLSQGHDPKKNGIMRFNVTLEESTFVWLMKVMRIHPSFIESLNYLIGHFAIFTSLSDDGKAPEFLRKSDGYKQIVDVC